MGPSASGRWSGRACPLARLALLTSALLPAAARAAAVSSVQSGTVVLPAGSATVSVPVTAVVPAQAFLVFGVRFDDADPQDSQVSGQLADATTLTFARSAAGGIPVTISWYLAAFSSGVAVQRGSHVWDLASATNDVALAVIDLGKAFPLVSYRIGGATYNLNDFVRARLTSTTNLELSVGSGPDVSTVEWQVVEFTGADVRSGDLVFAPADTARTVAVPAMDPARSWLLYGFNAPDGASASIGQKLLRGLVQDPTTLAFDRDVAGATLNLTWFVVSFTDATWVQSGSAAFGSAELARDVTIAAVDRARALAAGGYLARGGKSPYATDDNPGTGWMTLELKSTTDLALGRGTLGPGAAATADLGWFVVEFDDGMPRGDAGGDGVEAGDAATEALDAPADGGADGPDDANGDGPDDGGVADGGPGADAPVDADQDAPAETSDGATLDAAAEAPDASPADVQASETGPGDGGSPGVDGDGDGASVDGALDRAGAVTLRIGCGCALRGASARTPPVTVTAALVATGALVVRRRRRRTS